MFYNAEKHLVKSDKKSHTRSFVLSTEPILYFSCSLRDNSVIQRHYKKKSKKPLLINNIRVELKYKSEGERLTNLLNKNQREIYVRMDIWKASCGDIPRYQD